MGNILAFDIHKTYPGFKLMTSASLEDEIVAVFGASGSGKTTLLDCISGLSSPDDGDIILNNKPLFSSANKVNVPPERRRIGYIFQDPLLFPHLTVNQNILYGFNLTPVSKRIIDLGGIVKLLELEPIMNRHPKGLSGGERQRVALARSLATSPSILLLDEPLASLHFSMRGRILRYLKDIHKHFSMPMIYVSHSISEVLAIADKVIVLDNGKQLGFDMPHKILLGTEPTKSMELEPLENLVNVTISEHRRSTGLTIAKSGEDVLALPIIETSLGTLITVAIKASDIIIATEPPQKLSARNILSGHITKIYYNASLVIVKVTNSREWLIEITPEAVQQLQLKQGQKVFMIMKSSSIRILG